LMVNDLRQRLEKLREDFAKIEDSINLEEKKLEVKRLEAEATDPNLWQDQEKAKNLLQKLESLKEEIKKVVCFKEDLFAIEKLLKSGQAGPDLLKELEKLEKTLRDFKLASFLSGKYDAKNALVSIHAGQGGTEAMDWASMLYRMYLRFCEKKGWSCQTLDLAEGEEAGLKSVTFKVSGNYAYGYLKGESGTHRLVRQSPFNADKLRHTSFALVGVLPELTSADLPGILIKDSDLSWQFFRASTQGGQNVQKVSTAVRVKHLPTGIVATAQTQRFQEQNRKIALELLRAKLWALEEEKKEKKVAEIKGEYKPASWGYQIRSYILHPYKMVKDLRTKVETGKVDKVLDGEIDEFIEAELKLL